MMKLIFQTLIENGVDFDTHGTVEERKGDKFFTEV